MEIKYKKGLGVQSRIKSTYGNLLPAEKKIADYLLSQQFVPFLDIDSLAKETQTSKASVSRFCRRLGYGGFKEFSLHLAKDTNESTATESNYIESMVRRNAQACLDTRYLIEEEQVDQMVQEILSAERIFLFGSAAVEPVISDFFQKMLRLGIVCHQHPGQRIQAMEAAIVREEDLVIAFDLSGESRSTIEVVETAANQGAYCITICCGIGSALGEIGDMHLYGVGQKQGNYVTGTMETRISLLNIVDIIFSRLMKVMPKDEAISALNKTKDVILQDWN